MDVKLYDLVVSFDDFKKLMEARGLPAKRNYWLSKLYTKVSHEVEVYGLAERKLFDEYGQRVNDMGQYTIPSENISVVEQQLTELRTMKVELSFDPVTMNELELLGDVLSPASMARLDWLLQSDIG
jgi:hypothetical protein